jgi:predicted phosphodiesterase
MRFGLIGDVHAEDERLAAALEALANARVERALCTGDLVDGLGDVDRVCGLLRSHRVVTVRGNHDRWIRDDSMRTLPNAHSMTTLAVESIELLKSLPPTALVPTAIGGLLLCHGVADNDMCKLGAEDFGYAISSNEDLLRVLFDPAVAVMVGGHTHKRYVRRFERAQGKPPLVVVNAGTLARDDDPCFAILDDAAKSVEFYVIDDTLRVSLSSRAIL